LTEARINFPNRTASKLVGSDLYAMISHPWRNCAGDDHAVEAARRRPTACEIRSNWCARAGRACC
jgi:hypothetical protein